MCRTWRSTLFVVVTFIAVAKPAGATHTTRTYEFSGEVTAASGVFFAGQVGDRFSGSFVYDTAAVLSGSNATNGFYNAGLLSLIVDGVSIPPVQLRVHNEAPGGDDVLTLFGGVDVNDVRLTLFDRTGTAFSSIAIPDALDLADFPDYYPNQLIKLPGVPGPVFDVGVVDTLRQVPEPATIWICLLGIAVATSSRLCNPWRHVR